MFVSRVDQAADWVVSGTFEDVHRTQTTGPARRKHKPPGVERDAHKDDLRTRCETDLRLPPQPQPRQPARRPEESKAAKRRVGSNGQQAIQKMPAFPFHLDARDADHQEVSGAPR